MHLKHAPVVDRKVRFALAGCGRIAANHFESLARHADRAELVAVCDTAPDALAAAQERTGARGYGRYSEMLAALTTDQGSGRGADCVVLTTPSGLHPQQAIEAAGSGLHVMTEKPMATRWADGLAMVKACDEAGVRLFVVKQNRRNRTLQLLREAIQGGRFGRIYMVTVNVFWSRPQSYYDSADWRGTWEFDGGAFMNQASHYIDLLDWLIGPVESVMAYTGTLARNIEVEDTGVAALKWRNGAMGSVNVTMLTHPKNFEGSITVLGEKGTVRIGGVAVNKIEHWEFDTLHDMDGQLDDASYQTTSVYGFGHPLYYDNVIRTLRGECEPETDGREGLKSLELLIAMYRSARDGKRINLPLEY
jgi:UDP-N-acetyl-2-amino-2-deoxyglucuronate dehydrogenase